MASQNSRGQCATEAMFVMLILAAFVLTALNLSRQTRELLRSSQLSQGHSR